MSGVVLRCPNCGTTRSSTGECEACHEAQVRYFCTNHDPGRWLDAAACGQCGARFGVAAPAPASPTPAGRPPTRGQPTSAGRGTASAPGAPPPARPGADPRAAGPGGERVGAGRGDGGRPTVHSRRRRSPDATGLPPGVEDAAVGSGSPPAGWRELLVAVARAHQRRAEARAGTESGIAVRRRRSGGCLSRLFLLAMFIVFALMSTFMFGGSFLRMFLPY